MILAFQRLAIQAARCGQAAADGQLGARSALRTDKRTSQKEHILIRREIDVKHHIAVRTCTAIEKSPQRTTTNTRNNAAQTATKNTENT